MKKGDTVKVLKSKIAIHKTNKEGVIISNSHRGEPFKVVFEDGYTCYFSKKSLKLIKES